LGYIDIITCLPVFCTRRTYCPVSYETNNTRPISPTIATKVKAIAKRLQYSGDSEYSSSSSPLRETPLYRVDKNSSEKITAQAVPDHNMIVRIAGKIDINNSKVVRCRYYNR
jgi:hypothetical protein